MLSIEHTKKILNDPTISDEEVEKIRDTFRALADIVFEKWQQEKGWLENKNKNYDAQKSIKTN